MGGFYIYAQKPNDECSTCQYAVKFDNMKEDDRRLWYL